MLVRLNCLFYSFFLLHTVTDDSEEWAYEDETLSPFSESQ